MMGVSPSVRAALVLLVLPPAVWAAPAGVLHTPLSPIYRRKADSNASNVNHIRDDPYSDSSTSTPAHAPITPSSDFNFSTPEPVSKVQVLAMRFMQKFGYLPKEDINAASYFDTRSLEKDIIRVQKFGNIPQTGVIDNATLQLMETPRCGLPDVDPYEDQGEHIRRKRFILGGDGWKKRKITYLVANWSPQLRTKENVQRELRRAFDAWSTYSNLQFLEVNHTTADIIIYFASYDHSDGYAFDGPSGILAHAYYPYEFGSYGGDVHFDESEEWTIRPKDDYSGLDFFTVAVHEIGHSLGLAHSPVSGSIMFPYYKGYKPSFSLDYDDVMAMWELYIKRKLDGDDEYFKSTTTTTTTPATYPDEDHQADAAGDNEGDGVDRRKNGGREEEEEEDDFYEEDRKRREEEERRREEERKRQREEDEERKRWEEEIRKKEVEARRREEEERRRWEEEEEESWVKRKEGDTTKAPPTLPNICHGSYDAVALLRQELFIFKDEYLWRYSARGRLREGYPSLIRSLFPALPTFLKKVDAVFERYSDSSIIFFIGKYYYVHDGDRLVEGSPLPLTNLGLPQVQTSIDAALYWPRAQKTYFFSRDWYYRYNDAEGRMDDGYPKNITKWNGLPNNLDAAFTYSDGESYFFRGYQFWRYNNKLIRPAAGYPKNAPEYWAGCDPESQGHSPAP